MNEFDNATPGSEGADDEFEYSNDSEDMSVDGLGSDMDELESAPSLYSYSSSRDGPYFLRCVPFSLISLSMLLIIGHGR
jgi:hypothetical protein